MFNRKKSLKGRKIAVLAADGFEKIEYSVPVTALKSEGAHVEVVSLRNGWIRGVNLHEPAGRVRVKKTLAEANPSDYDGLFIPGGFINPDLLRQSAEARKFVQAFDEARKPIATLCHGPWVLASAGLAKGRTLTSWPGVRDDLVNAGATWLNQEVVKDRNWISSRGPQDLVPFTQAITEFFAAEGPITESAPEFSRSAPQADTPPQTIITAMRWMPKPSLRTTFGLAALAIGYWIANKRKNLSDRSRVSFRRNHEYRQTEVHP